MKKSIFAIAALLLASGVSSTAMAALGSDSQEVVGLERGISLSGMTGLMHTISPYTSGTGINATLNGLMQPTTTGNQVILQPSATIGIGQRLEISGRTALVSAPGVSEVGDTEIFVKYKFRSLGEVMPAMALVASVILPTASAATAADVNTSSGRLLLVAGGDAQVSDNTIIGVYFNAGFNYIDPGLGTQNDYLTYSLGVMAPISDDNRLHGYIEFNSNQGKSAVTPLGGSDGGHLQIGARYATRLLKITAGVETGWSTPVVYAGVTVGF